MLGWGGGGGVGGDVVRRVGTQQQLQVTCKTLSETVVRLRVFFKTRMVVHGQLVEPAVCLSDLYDVFLSDTVRDTRQNLWTMIYRSQ